MTNLKIFKMDDYSWYVAHDLMEFLNWYHKNVESIETEEDLSELKVINPEDDWMLDDSNITQEDIKKLGDLDSYHGETGGDIMRLQDKIYKERTFAEVLGDEDIKEPYEIASAEW